MKTADWRVALSFWGRNQLFGAVQSTEGAFDAAVRANVEKDAQLALLREELTQAQHKASAASTERLADSEISGAQLAALQSSDALPAAGDGAGCDRPRSTQLSAPPANLAGPQSTEVQPAPADIVLSLQQLASGWLSDDMAADEPHQAGAQPPPADAAISNSAPVLMQVPIVEAVVPTAEPATAREELLQVQACGSAAQVLLLLLTHCCFEQRPNMCC